ncbi:MAG TPA: right-handed parallel beta-helix repeat-containing protein, partial [Candidatus Eisenbacteria bacterium]
MLGYLVVGATLASPSRQAFAGLWVFSSPASGSDVQSVADRAADGDTLLFMPGRHEIQLELTDKSIVLVGQGGPGQVTLTRTAEEVIFKPGMIRITGATGGGNSFRASGIRFEGGFSHGRAQAAAIWAWEVSTVVIEDCQFINNRAVPSSMAGSNFGGAVRVWGASTIRLQGCLFKGNSSEASFHHDSSGGAAQLSGQFIEVRHCEFEANRAEGYFCGGGGGALIALGNFVTIADCNFFRNSASDGAALGANSNITIERCSFQENPGGGSLFGPCGVQEGSSVNISGVASIYQSTFIDNRSNAPALRLLGAGPHHVETSAFVGNGVSGGGSPAVRLGGSAAANVTFARNLVAFNHGPGIAHAITTEGAASCNIIWANNPDFIQGSDWRGAHDNQASDPLFCEGAVNDLLVANNSPCLPGGSGHPESCGVIGSVTAGCAVVSIRPSSWSGIKLRFGST